MLPEYLAPGTCQVQGVSGKMVGVEKVSDAAEFLNAYTEHGDLVVEYRVMGWHVAVNSQRGAPWEGPDCIQVGWSSTPEGFDAAIETDGVTTEVLRAIPLADARRRLRGLRLAARLQEPDVPALASRLSGVRDLAEFAKVYADAVADGQRHPLKSLAELTGIPRNTLSARVRRARDEGLLTRPHGRHLGELTGKARGLLQDMDTNQRKERVDG